MGGFPDVVEGLLFEFFAFFVYFGEMDYFCSFGSRHLVAEV